MGLIIGFVELGKRCVHGLWRVSTKVGGAWCDEI